MKAGVRYQNRRARGVLPIGSSASRPTRGPLHWSLGSQCILGRIISDLLVKHSCSYRNDGSLIIKQILSFSDGVPFGKMLANELKGGQRDRVSQLGRGSERTPCQYCGTYRNGSPVGNPPPDREHLQGLPDAKESFYSHHSSAKILQPDPEKRTFTPKERRGEPRSGQSPSTSRCEFLTPLEPGRKPEGNILLLKEELSVVRIATDGSAQTACSHRGALLAQYGA